MSNEQVEICCYVSDSIAFVSFSCALYILLILIRFTIAVLHISYYVNIYRSHNFIREHQICIQFPATCQIPLYLKNVCIFYIFLPISFPFENVPIFCMFVCLYLFHFCPCKSYAVMFFSLKKKRKKYGKK